MVGITGAWYMHNRYKNPLESRQVGRTIYLTRTQCPATKRGLDMFDKTNTQGYTSDELAELNRRLEAEIAELDPNDELYNELAQGASERVLAEFVPAGA